MGRVDLSFQSLDLHHCWRQHASEHCLLEITSGENVVALRTHLRVSHGHLVGFYENSMPVLNSKFLCFYILTFLSEREKDLPKDSADK